MQKLIQVYIGIMNIYIVHTCKIKKGTEFLKHD